MLVSRKAIKAAISSARQLVTADAEFSIFVAVAGVAAGFSFPFFVKLMPGGIRI